MRVFGVWIVPMRNWNYSFTLIWLLNGIIVWIVPMRNWNASAAYASAERTRVWIVPMRNWNTAIKGISRRHFQFGSYLWGIETCDGAARSKGRRRRVWIVPMRNWNGRRWRGIIGGAQFGSYLWGIETQIKIRMSMKSKKFGSYLWGIETSPSNTAPETDAHGLDRTYEELKPDGFGSRFSCRFWPCLDRTYEELKLWRLSRALSGGVRGFGSYLWGIETGCRGRVGLDWSKVWIVPMRNWNHKGRSLKFKIHVVWIVPMRNWN